MDGFKFKNLYLDKQYRETLERFLIRNKIITRMCYEDKDETPEQLEVLKTPLTGLHDVLRLLVFYEKFDCQNSIYNYDRLVDAGMVRNNAIVRRDKDIDISDPIIISDTVSLMKAYKNDVIRYIKQKSKENYQALCTQGDSKEFWKQIDDSKLPYTCSDEYGNLLELTKDYEEIIRDPEKLYPTEHLFDNPLYKFDVLLFNRPVEDEISSIRNDLLEGLHDSLINGSTFASSILSSCSRIDRASQIKAVYDVYDQATIAAQISLPPEADVLPMPQTWEDVRKFRKSQYIKSFRTVMREWCDCLEQGNEYLVNKMAKDVIKANQQLERLGKYKRATGKWYSRVALLAAGQFAELTKYTLPIQALEIVITEGIERKNRWALFPKVKNTK